MLRGRVEPEAPQRMRRHEPWAGEGEDREATGKEEGGRGVGRSGGCGGIGFNESYTHKMQERAEAKAVEDAHAESYSCVGKHGGGGTLAVGKGRGTGTWGVAACADDDVSPGTIARVACHASVRALHRAGGWRSLIFVYQRAYPWSHRCCRMSTWC